MSEDLRLYRTMVLETMSRAISTGEPEVFQNSGKAHARVVLGVMLDKAKESVDIVSGYMHKDVWPAEAVASCLARNPQLRIRVLFEGGSPRCIHEDSALAELSDQQNIEMRWMARTLPRHFCVTDKAHVRLEYDKITREASVTFGDPTGAGAQASQTFESLWDSSPVLKLQRAA